MKVYFAMFEQVFSMNKEDAIKMAFHAIKNDSFDPRIELKGRKNRRENGIMKIGKKYQTIHHCLDWKKEDWDYFLKTMDPQLICDL